MNFAEAMRNESHKTFTENGATAYNTTSNACVDLFGTIGALRARRDVEIESLFAEAYKEDRLRATKILFYARDIREGCGERRIFRVLIKYLAKYHPEALRPNLDLIGVYGRYDDLYELVGTPLEDDMWKAMKAQFEEDIKNYHRGNNISLLAKWIKTPDASSKKTRELGIKTAIKLGYKVYDFKRLLRELRKHLNIVERLMSTGQWDQISYSTVPSRAMKIYENAFIRHDDKRYNTFINDALRGKDKINASTLFPYDLTMKIFNNQYSDTVEAQWRQLKNYVEPGTNAICVVDTSGSMFWENKENKLPAGLAFASASGLGIYFAEHNTGAFHNMFMTFSSRSDIIELKGSTLKEKYDCMRRANVGMSTNIEAAFNNILDLALKNNVPKDEMVKSLIIISDMEFDRCSDNRHWSFYDSMRAKFEKAGYELPNIVFWNVNSRNNVFHTDANKKGVQLVSGHSATTFGQLVNSVGLTPAEMMYKVIDSERYESITVE